jgi:HTH-type transcriptional regulator, competence development regulator
MIIGQHLRELREEKGLFLRQVAAFLEVDTAYISKMERGEKSIKREYVLKLAKIYKTNPEKLITLWLADKILEIVKDETTGISAIRMAEESLTNRNVQR